MQALSPSLTRSTCCAELQKELQKDLYFMSTATFLSEDDLAKIDLPYAQFVQKKASRVQKYRYS